jgi:hypothetical protein
VIVLRDAPRGRRGPGATYAKALEAHERIERRLARAVRAWDRSREALRRMERRLDKQLVAQSHADAQKIDDLNDDL